MSSQADLQEKMHQFIDAIIEGFGGSEAPITRMNMSFLTYFIESQSIFLNLYQEYTKERIKEGDDTSEEHMKNVAKDFIKSYLEILQLQRKNREKFRKFQSEIVQDSLKILQDTLEYIHKAVPDPAANSEQSPR